MAFIDPRKTNKMATYVAPKLTRFGDVTRLTANGSKPGTENQGNREGDMV